MYYGINFRCGCNKMVLRNCLLKLSFWIAIPATINVLLSCFNLVKATSSTHPPANGTGGINSKQFPYMNTTPLELQTSDKPTASIIFIHDYYEIGPKYRKYLEEIQLPNMRIVLPTANKQLIIEKSFIRLTCWFNFSDYGGFPKLRPGYEHQLRESVSYIHHLIEEEIHKHNISSDRIFIAGINQGGTVALHAATSFPHKLAGCIAMSSWGLDKSLLNNTLNPANKQIPIMQTFCDRNPYTKHELQLDLQDTLKRRLKHKDFLYKTYRGSFSTSLHEWSDIKEFCLKHLK